ncbi:autotransporter assembly complex protein TamA [Bordetella petrii]|uniref:autotransporter assembly complex protein TamA n=1 Tax=Bordetella petrii TaxID=94624 RepID=UPI001A963FC0|nr:BamA/TamA family outer membrane protein [Bordetella petrii]MBO1113989.1 BamA/TamA family outer membrane protein [Bordetella petrii]
MRVGAALLLSALWGAAAGAYAKAPEVVIDPGGVPPAALQSITEAVGAITRLAEDQDGGEINRLRRRARDATLAALATQGYFTPVVTLETGTDVGGETWDISIQPGKRAHVASVDLNFTGRVTRPEYAERVAELRKNWSLPAGQPFINSEWNRAKATLLDAVASRDFMLAHMTASDAAVHADTAEVHLSITIDSGPLVRMGPLNTQGLRRVPDSLVQRYVRYTPGDPYRQDKLDGWQQDLQSTAFFRGAFVTLDTSASGAGQAGSPDAPPPAPPPSGRARAPGSSGLAAATPQGDPQVAGGPGAARPAGAVDSDGVVTLPVDVRVVEAPPKRLATSLGVDSDAGVRAEITYRQNVVFGQPVTLESGIGVDRLRQRAYLDFHLPPDEKGQRDSFGLLADHTDIQGLDVRRFALGATRLRERKGAGDSRVEYENRWGVLLAHDHVKIDGGDEYDLPSATLTSEWLRRDVDNKYDPREGNLIAVGGGVGVVLNSGQPFFRARLRGQHWWPVGQRDVLTVRGEVGRVWSDSKTRVPDDFGFRTGGARSIRGYRYQSIGVDKDDAVVGAPTLAVASIEYDHYFDERWGMAVFVDAGDAAESFGEMQMHVGYGVGARLRTPAGPLFLDLAYGQRERDLRLHFSLGIAF